MNKKQRKFKKKRQRMQKTVVYDSSSGDFQFASFPMLKTQQMPLWTKTGGLFQPVRIYYKVVDFRNVLKNFRKLTCMKYDSAYKHWIWFYTHEAADLAFEKRSFNPEKPVALGTFFFTEDHHMCLDVHSVERALEAIPFFDRYFSRRASQVTHLTIVNRLFDPSRARTFTFPRCIEAEALAEDPITSALESLDALRARAQDDEEKKKIIESYLKEERAEVVFPEIEHIALPYSRKRFQQLWLLLESRQYVAIQHWKGHVGYTHADYLREIVQGGRENFPRTVRIKRPLPKNRILRKITSFLKKFP